MNSSSITKDAVGQGFKRLNFFKGFFAQADDWNAFQAYHNDKRRLHNQSFYTCGIVPGYLADFSCEVKPDDEAYLRIQPGCALDAEGREILLSQPVDINAIPDNLHGSSTVYVIVRYHEEPIDHRRNGAQPDYSGYAYIHETAHIEVSTEKPDGQLSFELARYEVASSKQKIQNSDIHKSYRSFAGPVYVGMTARTGVEVPPRQAGKSHSAEINMALVLASEPSRCYVAMVQPTALLAEANKVRCQWEIQTEYSLAKDGQRYIGYFLCISNLSQVPIEVTCQWYRLS